MQWEPQAPVPIGTDVHVAPDVTNAEFYPVFVPNEHGSVPLKTNLQLTFNPGTSVLTVPFIDSIVTNAVDSVNSLNVNVMQEGSNAVMYPTFVNGTNGNKNARVNTGMTYNPSTNTLSLVSGQFSGNLINVNTINGSAYPPPYLPPLPTGNTLTVDTVYGDDTNAVLNPFSVPFKTIKAAMNAATTGQNVRVVAGTYTFTEGLVMQAGVSLTGASTQCVVLSWLNATVSLPATTATMITMAAGCRIENVTINLSSSTVNLTGIQFPVGTSLTSKIRSSVVNVTYTGGVNKTVLGLLSDGAESYDTKVFNSVDAIARSTLNVTSNSTGNTKGVSLTAKNRFGIRESVINVTGSGFNVVGVETSAIDAYCSIKTSTVNGTSTSTAVGTIQYDINRASTSSTILLGFTDLVNNNANGNSFSVVTVASTTTFGVFDGLRNGVLNLVPGTIDKNTTVPTFEIPIVQNMVLFSGVVRFTGSLVGHTVTFNAYKNAIVAPVFTIVMTNTTGGTVLEDQKSVDFNKGDTYYATVTSNSNISSGTFTATLAFY